MKVINLFAGPGAGKSTTAAALYVTLKNKAHRTELVGEEAKDQIYWGSKNQLANQLFLAAMQYVRLKNLEMAGCEIAIADSPLIQSPSYARNSHYYKELEALVSKINSEFHNINIFINRTKPYDNFGRTQKDVEEAKVIDEQIRKTGFGFHLEVTGDAVGQAELGEWVLRLLDKGK